MAPEVTDSEYNEKCDVWSCAIIMYMLLTGNPPFQGNNDDEIILSVKKQEYSLERPELIKVSEEAKDLIKKILVPEEKRLSAAEALLHPWFNSNPMRKNIRRTTITSVTENLKNFKSSFKLQEAVQAFIINQIMPINDTRPTREVFSLIDKDQDGKINEADLIDYLQQNMEENEAKSSAKRMMKQIDSEGKGWIEYSQYLRASLDISTILSRKNLITAFNMLDTQKEGYISAEKLMSALSTDESSIEVWKSVIIEAGKKGDGTIDMQQFIELLQKI